MTIDYNSTPYYPGTVGVSSFLREVIEKKGGNDKFHGSFDDLTNLVRENFENWIPGVGSVNGDVRIVHLPTEGFFTDIVEITPENAHLLKVGFEARVEGEAPVSFFYFEGMELSPASHVGIVIYHADVLARDNGRSTDAEWEIVAILADPKENVPMNPMTMARNAAHVEGGTYREYSSEQWLESVLFWQAHAKIGSDTP